jgi:tocopherol cyclase
MARDRADSHAFIMLLDARKHRLCYVRYPPDSFAARKNPFELTIGGSRFSTRGISLDMADGATTIHAEMRFSKAVPWPVRALSPGVMGWYAFVPGMECYHGVLSFTHAIDGYIDISGDRVDLSGGRGYSEKDWGRSMPTSWIWMQTNHFDEDDISLTGSVARIPWLGRAFTGFIFGLYLRGRLYRFTTYTGAKVSKISMTDERIDLVIEDRVHRLEIGADRAEGVSLPAPRLGEMTARVSESLSSHITVDLYRKDKAVPEMIFSGTGRNAGLEFVGDLQELLHGLKK